MIDYTSIAMEALAELGKARQRFGPMASAHEGYAILLEEVDELWEEVRGNKRDITVYKQALRAEAIQIAAMAIAFIGEVCDG